jgi:hypothetical protein
MTRLLLARGAEAGRREIKWAQGPRRAEIAALLEDAARKSAAKTAGEQDVFTGRAAGAVLSTAAASGVDAPSYTCRGATRRRRPRRRRRATPWTGPRRASPPKTPPPSAAT